MVSYKSILEQYTQMQKALNGGCRDGYCVIEKTKWLHTNGGCYCLEDLTFQERQYIGRMLLLGQDMYIMIEDQAEQLRIATEGLEECRDEIDDYIRQEYPLDHPLHERYRQRDFSSNPARTTLAKMKEKEQ